MFVNKRKRREVPVDLFGLYAMLLLRTVNLFSLFPQKTRPREKKTELLSEAIGRCILQVTEVEVSVYYY